MTFSDGGHSVYKKGYDSNGISFTFLNHLGTIKDEQSSLFLRGMRKWKLTFYIGSVNSSTTNGAESHMKAKGHSQPYHSANKSTHRRCMSCHSPNPAGYWIRNYQSPEGVICQICFAKKNLSSTDLVIDDSSQLLCSGCYDATRHGRPPFTDCPQCRASQLQRVFRSCSSCNEQSTFGSWYRDTANPGHFCCHKCYHNSNKIRLDTLPDGVVIHRTCSSCTAPKSSSWYRDLNITGAYICKQCYNQRYQSRTEIQPDGTAIPRACKTIATNYVRYVLCLQPFCNMV
ncbi:hypothetical protein BC833DRAFT_340810 [Globomyces pollinis-pini]|nr:hypothetical protein BC833DRAFT_340810 [Globomyces pollinis-pini]